MAYKLWTIAAACLLAGVSVATQAQDSSAGSSSSSSPGSSDSSSGAASSSSSDSNSSAASPSSGDSSASSSDASSSSSSDSTASSSSDSGSSDSSSGGGFFSSLFTGLDYSIHGFLRSEDALSTGFENPNNQRGNFYNGVVEHRVPGLPGTPTTLVPLPGVDFAVANPALATTIARPIRESNNAFNDHTIRAEFDFNASFSSDLKFEARLRTVTEIGHYSEFNGASLNGTNEGGITGGYPSIYGGAPNYFQYRVDGSRHPNPLEISGANYQAYFPVFIFNYAHGPLNIRLGNQQIAWGQAIFFRVLDVPDGLDLRRHLILGKATEEYSDVRIPAPALRVGYQFNDEILADAYVQKFQPTVYPNANTPYAVIPAQFTIHDLYHQDGDDNKVSYGIRVKGDYGQFGFQAIAVRRINPDGIFRWTQSGVNKSVPNVDAVGNPNPLGITENTLNNGATPNPYALSLPPSTTGQLLAHTPVEASPGGVYSANEFCGYAAYVRLKCVEGLNKLITDFEPYTDALLASPVTSFGAAHNELDTFFTAAGGDLRGHVRRDYYEENVFGLGGSYVTDAEPGSLLDQIVINLETTIVPHRTFTPVDLGVEPLRQLESTTALVMEKYQRFSNAFPATFMVFQALHKTRSDLFGRSLRGYGGSETKDATGVGGGATNFVLAAVQPLPQDVFEGYFAALGDPRGGLLFQPGLRWKPDTAVTVEGFYTYINGHLGSNPSRNVISTLDFADEASIRLTYQF